MSPPAAPEQHLGGYAYVFLRGVPASPASPTPTQAGVEVGAVPGVLFGGSDERLHLVEFGGLLHVEDRVEHHGLAGAEVVEAGLCGHGVSVRRVCGVTLASPS